MQHLDGACRPRRMHGLWASGSHSVEALGQERGPALWRVLRCSKCGSLGKAELRLIWTQEGNPLAGGHGGKPRERAS